MPWTPEELHTTAAAEELEIATRRTDGTLRAPVTVWVVRRGEEVYVRSVNGRESSWFRGAQDRHEARIRAGTAEKDVRLVETDESPDELDAAYRDKYRRYAVSILDHITSTGARAATLMLVPHEQQTSP